VPNGDFNAKPPPSRVLSSWSGVAWQEAQPPAKKMVLPLARSAVRGASALAGTVAGMVTTQNTPNARTTAIAAAAANLRSIAPFPFRAI